MKKKLILAGSSLIVLVLLIACFWYLNIGDDVALGATFNVTAQKTSPAGVEADTGFLISSDTEINEDELTKLVFFNPAIDFTLTAQDKQNFLLQPSQELSAGQVYQLTIGQSTTDPNPSWAFQTKGSFQLVSSIPADRSTYVPVSSGIEFNFSAAPGDASNYFSMEPAIKGSWKTYNQTAVFVPDKNLAEDTIYTVTLKKGLPSAAGDTLSQDYTFAFRTESAQNNEEINFFAYDFSETYLTSDDAILKFYASSNLNNTDMTVDLYRLASAEDYLRLAREYQENNYNDYFYAGLHLLSTDGLNLTASINAGHLQRKDYNYEWSPAYLILPENPGAGWYLAEITANNDAKTKTQKLIQISDIAVYSQSAAGETLFWCHDAATGKAAANAKITVAENEAKATGATGKDGKAIIDTGEMQLGDVIITTGSKTFASLTNLEKTIEQSPRELYYTYVYTDRSAYLPSDTVNFWGVILPRSSNTPDMKNLVLVLPDGVDGQDVKLDVSSGGAFSGSFTFNYLLSGYHTFEIQTTEGKTVYSKYFNVMEYTKPSYVLSFQTDKKYYRQNETIQATLTGNFYDGTPAEGMDMKISSYGHRMNDFTQKVTLDENGEAFAQIKLKDSATNWSPYNIYLQARTSGANEVYSYTDASCYYFPSDYMLQAANQDTADNSWQINIAANKIDFTPLDKGNILYDNDFPNNIKGATADMSGKVNIVETTYVKTQTGQYYDFINKVTCPIYEYSQVDKTVKTIPFTTSGGTWTSPVLDYQSNVEHYYHAEISYTTPDKRNLTETIYPNYPIYPYDAGLKQYSLQTPDDKDNFKENETIDFTLMENNAMAASGGQLLYTMVQKNIQQSAVATNNKFSLTMTAAQIPNVRVYAAYFDGKHIFEVSPRYLNFEQETRELKVEISTDKDVYLPGEEAIVNVKVTDDKGKPIATELLLSVVDEAAFAVEEQDLNFLRSLYESVFYNNVSTSASYIQHDIMADNGGAEKGGEGDAAAVRKDFVDTAAFISLKTGADGQSQTTLTLPDNLTSWRLTALAVNSEAYAGQQIANVQTSIPYFIQLTANKRYLTGDDVAAAATVYGKEVTAQTEVNYEVTIAGENGFTKTLTATGQALKRATFNFGKLAKGSYTLTARAASPGASDALAVNLDVVDSLQEIPLSKELQATELSALNPLRYPVTMMLYDQDNALYFTVLSHLLNACGERADQKLARALALKRLAEIYPQFADYAAAAEDVYLDGLQNWDGGLALFSYADSDPFLTAQALAMTPDFMQAENAASYLYQIIYNSKSSPGDVAAAYMGLAALKEPVLTEITRLINDNNSGFSLSEKSYLACGLAFIGDFNGAREWYKTNLLPLAEDTTYGKQFKAGNDEDVNFLLTTSALMLTGSINDSDCPTILKYVLNNPSDKYTDFLPCAVYTQRYLPKLNTEASYSYTLDGKTTELDLTNQTVAMLNLSASELKNLQITAKDGNLGLTALYIGGTEALTGMGNNLITATQALSGGSFKAGESITGSFKASFNNDAPGGWYIVNIVIPTGMRFSDYHNDGNCYLVRQEGQRLTFLLNRTRSGNYVARDGSYTNKDELAEISFNYTLRALLPGNYIMEPAVISHEGVSAYTKTESQTITIQP